MRTFLVSAYGRAEGVAGSIEVAVVEDGAVLPRPLRWG